MAFVNARAMVHPHGETVDGFLVRWRFY